MLSNQSLLLRACTFDELLSEKFKANAGEKSQADLATGRLAAWCKASASGDWSLFARRLEKDQITFKDALARFANAELDNPISNLPSWFSDAQWVYDLLTQQSDECIDVDLNPAHPIAFQDIFLPLLQAAHLELQKMLTPNAYDHFTAEARAELNSALLKQLSDLASPLLYSLFVKDLKSLSPDGKLPPSDADTNKNHYSDFIVRLQDGVIQQQFNEKPVLIRLLATITRQWINTTSELINRLSSDLTKIKEQLLHSKASIKVSSIEGGLSDLHNLGHSVRILGFDDGSKVVYKPKDLGLDVVFINFIHHLNGLNPPVQLRVADTIACDGYGWCEFIEHEPCQSLKDIELFYERSGSWLTIFHLLAGGDMHHENIIACGSEPVPIDLETILQASTPELQFEQAALAAFNQTVEKIQDSVLMVGMLPAYAKSPKNKIYDMGALNVGSENILKTEWKNINTNGMRWVQFKTTQKTFANIPRIDSDYAKFGDYKTQFISGFEKYANFLLEHKGSSSLEKLWRSFANLPVRKVVRPTRFYYTLMQRLKDYRNMDDGVKWSVQADFLARLGEWDAQTDLLWPLQKSEREAMFDLNIPFFLSQTDGNQVSDIFGNSIKTPAISGLQRAKKRWQDFSKQEIDWQSLLIRISTSFVSTSDDIDDKKVDHSYSRKLEVGTVHSITSKELTTELAVILDELDRFAFQDEKSISWLGLDWLPESEIAQLAPLTDDLYGGKSGIALFLAAYHNHFQDKKSKKLLFKILNGLHEQIHSSSSARWASRLGVGGAGGLGSLIYTLTTIAQLIDDKEILKDAIAASRLMTDDLIHSDQSLDVIGGSAGAILSLLALYRQTQSSEVLNKAVLCGEHLLNTPRIGEEGRRSWIGLGLGSTPLNGMSHGSAGFAYALTSLHQITQRSDFADAAKECLAYEASNYDEDALNWPDLREDEDGKPLRIMVCQWCHGATGIGLARIGSVKTGVGLNLLEDDIKNAAKCAELKWPNAIDTLCCGTLGNIELLNEAGLLLNDQKLKQLSDTRLNEIISNRLQVGDYGLGPGGNQFNLGLFRGISGIGYTLLRRLNPSYPNVLLWE
jgi:hypothetical protein